MGAFTFTQIPQPIQSSSESTAILDVGDTSIHNLPMRTTGQDFLHSCRHRFGLHLSVLTMAIRVCLSVSSTDLFFDIFIAVAVQNGTGGFLEEIEIES